MFISSFRAFDRTLLEELELELLEIQDDIVNMDDGTSEQEEEPYSNFDDLSAIHCGIEDAVFYIF